MGNGFSMTSKLVNAMTVCLKILKSEPSNHRKRLYAREFFFLAYFRQGWHLFLIHMEYLFGADYKDVKAFAWWKTGHQLGVSEKLCDIAGSLVGTVESTAGFKIQFRTLDLTYGTLRKKTCFLS